MKLIRSHQNKSKSSIINDKNTRRILLSNAKIDIKNPLVKENVIKLDIVRGEYDKRDLLITTVKKGEMLFTKTKELLAIRDDEMFQNDRAVALSLERLVKMTDIKRITLDRFFDEIKQKFENDIRYAYKEIDTVSSKNARHSVYIYHIYAIIIATMSILNEIDFKPSVSIEFKGINDELYLSFEIKSKSVSKVTRKSKLLEAPNIEMRLEYIGALCREDGIDSTIEIASNTFKIEFYIFKTHEREGQVYSTALEEAQFFDEFMDIFNYRVEDKQEEELD